MAEQPPVAPDAATSAPRRESSYAVARPMRPDPTTATFTLRDCPPQATAVVLDENRQIKITNGTFRDDFAKPYQVHIYRIGFSPASGKASGAR